MKLTDHAASKCMLSQTPKCMNKYKQLCSVFKPREFCDLLKRTVGFIWSPVAVSCGEASDEMSENEQGSTQQTDLLVWNDDVLHMIDFKFRFLLIILDRF